MSINSRNRVFTATISQLRIYPIKSLGPVALSRARLADRGLHLDRRWMLVDDHARFISQREHPILTLVQVELAAAGLRIRAPGMNDLEIPTNPPSTEDVPVRIWKDTCAGQPVGDEADRWFSEFLGKHCRLVFMPDTSRRIVRAPYAQTPRDLVSFADSFPYLVISEASLKLLNDRLAAGGESPVAMGRFRPNIVVTGCPAHAEDQWKGMGIRDAVLRAGKLCSRCVVTTVDPDTAQTHSEPLRTLSTYRLQEGKVVFGNKFIQEWTRDNPREHWIHVGDTVQAW